MGKEYTKSDYQKMSIEELRPIYKAACKEWVRVDELVRVTREVLHAKQEIATAEARVKAVKGKHATNAGQGGGL
jgi:hypothetical protein